MIFLSGATGNIGTATVRALDESSVPFRMGTRTPSVARDDSVLFDWSRPETFGPALQGTTTALLLTPVALEQVEYTAEFVKAAKAAGVAHIVKISVMGADPVRGIALQRLHAECERLVRESGIPCTMLRPTAFMQNFVLHYGADPNRDSTVFLPQGTGRVSWIDAEDVGAVAARMLIEPRPGAFELTGPSALSAAEVLSVFSETFGHRYEYLDVPPEAAARAMQGQGFPPWLVEGLLELHGAIKQGFLAAVSPTVQDILGRPARSFSQFASEIVRARSALH